MYKTGSALFGALLILSALVAGSSEALAQNILVNGDFEQGPVGYTSDYALQSLCRPEQTHCVNANATQCHDRWLSVNDHSTGSGLMFMANGATTAGAVAYSQSVSVVPNSYYELSLWVAEPYVAEAHPLLEISVNGLVLGSIAPIPQIGTWRQFSTTWFSDTATSATIEIIDLETAGGGNDFLLDDISLVGVGGAVASQAISWGTLKAAPR